MRLNAVTILIFERENSYIHECGCNLIAQATSQMVGQICTACRFFRASQVAQLVKNPSSLWETWVRSLGWEYPLEKGTATHSSILSWRINSMNCIVHGVAKSWTQLSEFHFHRFLDCPEQTKCTKCLRPIYIITCMDKS